MDQRLGRGGGGWRGGACRKETSGIEDAGSRKSEDFAQNSGHAYIHRKSVEYSLRLRDGCGKYDLERLFEMGDMSLKRRNDLAAAGGIWLSYL